MRSSRLYVQHGEHWGRPPPEPCYHRGVLDGVLSFLKTHRRRIAPLVLGAAVLVVGREWQDHAPSDVEVELPIGERHADVTRVDVSFEEADELVHHVSLRYPEGAPESVRHTVELAPGRYTVAVDLTMRGDETESRVGRLVAPAEGLVRVSLEGEGS